MAVHRNLTGADLHEPKGADTALSGQVYVADGAGSGSWLDASTIITNSAFTTGDLKITHKTTADTGWILWTDGSIGDGSSSATIRANADTEDLFILYWTNCADSLAPVSGGRGASAAADFAAHKRLSLPRGAGRAITISGSGSGLLTRTLGSWSGADTVTLVTANLPAYTPSGTVGVTVTSTVGNIAQGISVTTTPGGGFAVNQIAATGFVTSTGTGIFTGSAQGGTSTPVSIIQPATNVNVMIKL